MPWQQLRSATYDNDDNLVAFIAKLLKWNKNNDNVFIIEWMNKLMTEWMNKILFLKAM